MKKVIVIITISLLTTASFAQESEFIEPNVTLPKVSFLDSLKATFVNHNTSNCIDERWMAELVNEEIFENMLSDVTTTNIDSIVTFDLSSDLLKKRLQKIDSKTPFNVEYTLGLENLIKSFLKNRKGAFERLMAISEYYFPMFEEHLAKYNIPLEIKYLAIVESALNPKAKSRVGATGLWQFMYPTGKQFNLEVNSYVDERYDPLKATEAACQYLSNLYSIFGDWSLVLASYNAGPGNVSKAIRRSGGSQNYWNIRKNLPKETANYVPAFLATLYIYEYKKEHGLKPKKAPTTYFETDTITIKKRMTFQQISELLDVPVSQIAFLNPIYKLNIIPFDSEKAHFLRLPKNKIGLFVSNEDKIYSYIAYQESLKEKPFHNTILASESKTHDNFNENKTISHKVKSGESLGLIAKKYNTTIINIKKWNKISGNTIQAGKIIKIYLNEKQVTPIKTNTSNDGYYTVKSGDSLFSISRQFPGVTVDNLKKWNDISGDDIQPGMKLKING